MNTLVVLAALLAPGQDRTPSQLVSAMLARYNGAQSMTGSITFTQSAGDSSGQIVTQLQFERPAKLYIRQEKKTANAQVRIITCDGKHFTYDKPNDGYGFGSGRLIEPVKVGNLNLTLGEIYAISAAKSIPDRSVPLDIAIGRKEDLEFIRSQWTNLRAGPSKEQGGEALSIVMGDWREYGSAPVTGRFQLSIGPSGDLRQYAIQETLVVEGQQISVLSRWDVDLKVNGAPDQKLFKLVL